MSKKYPGGIIRGTPVVPTTSSAPGIWTVCQAQNYTRQGIWPRSPGAPTIGTATDTTAGGAVSVTFSAPSCIGSNAITGYIATSTPSCITGTAASSPLTVTGLTNGTSYTFKVKATNGAGTGPESAASNSATPTLVVVGQQAFTTAGTFSWVAPAGVTKVSVVTVGGGAGGGYSPGSQAGNSGGTSYFATSTTVAASGGTGGQGNGCYSFSDGGVGGTALYGTGYSGGKGGAGQFGGCVDRQGYGGGAAGYTGNGGAGQSYAYSPCYTKGGGGVGILGGASGGNISGAGQGGSGGANGTGGFCGNGGAYGGGGSGYASGGGGGGGGLAYINNYSVTPGNSYTVVVGNLGTSPTGQNGAVGAVRIIWPGTTRSFPSTCTGNL